MDEYDALAIAENINLMYDSLVALGLAKDIEICSLSGYNALNGYAEASPIYDELVSEAIVRQFSDKEIIAGQGLIEENDLRLFCKDAITKECVIRMDDVDYKVMDVKVLPIDSYSFYEAQVRNV